MQSVTESEHLSKPEFREAVSLLVAQLREVLGDEQTFAERETTSLWLLSEVQREYGRQELQGIADGFHRRDPDWAPHLSAAPGGNGAVLQPDRHDDDHAGHVSGGWRSQRAHDRAAGVGCRIG